jgi:sugar transferase (PEP-CTERM/EpsH1 system associated)
MFRAPALGRVVSNWCREAPFDAVLLSASSMASYTTLDDLRETPLYVDLVDIDSDKWSQYAKASRLLRPLYRLEARRVRRLEGRLTQTAEAVTLVSEREAEDFRLRCEEDGLPRATTAKIRAVFNGVDLEYFQPQSNAGELSCTFVGAMDYLPNIEAVRWFATNVWPTVRERYPAARFCIVGRNPAAPVTQLAKLAGVTVTGPVDDVRPWISRSAAVVAPLQIARGIQNKVLEAMAMGRPVVATPQALAGLDVEVPQEAFCARGVEEWHDTIQRLFEDERLRAETGASARRYVETHHAWEATLQPLRRLLAASAKTGVTALKCSPERQTVTLPSE